MGRPPLTADQHATVALHARCRVQAVDVALSRSSEPPAVAELALIAVGRPDLIDQVAEVIRHPWIRHPRRTGRLVRHGWRCWSGARRVTLGSVPLVGPDGVHVEQVTLTGKHGGPPVRYLRLRHHGYHVGDFRTVEELARHIELATLTEQPPASVEQPPGRSTGPDAAEPPQATSGHPGQPHIPVPVRRCLGGRARRDLAPARRWWTAQRSADRGGAARR